MARWRQLGPRARDGRGHQVRDIGRTYQDELMARRGMRQESWVQPPTAVVSQPTASGTGRSPVAATSSTSALRTGAPARRPVPGSIPAPSSTRTPARAGKQQSGCGGCTAVLAVLAVVLLNVVPSLWHAVREGVGGLIGSGTVVESSHVSQQCPMPEPTVPTNLPTARADQWLCSVTLDLRLPDRELKAFDLDHLQVGLSDGSTTPAAAASAGSTGVYTRSAVVVVETYRTTTLVVVAPEGQHPTSLTVQDSGGDEQHIDIPS